MDREDRPILAEPLDTLEFDTYDPDGRSRVPLVNSPQSGRLRRDAPIAFSIRPRTPSFGGRPSGVPFLPIMQLSDPFRERMPEQGVIPSGDDVDGPFIPLQMRTL